MPELPEVETVVRGLREVLPGRRVLSVRLGKTNFIDDPAALERELPGQRVTAVRRFGKFILLDLESKAANAASARTLLIHLGMTGRLRVYPLEEPVVAHTHVFLALDDGRELRYNDVRRFGRMAVMTAAQRDLELGGLGVDPLEANAQQFTAALRGRRARIKALLLDQSVLRGLGNIYADESLWRARIHPARLGASLSEKELRALYRAVQHILKEAIRLKGSSISNYVDAEGQRGKFQQRHRAYHQDGKKCSRCAATIQRTIIAGRSTHFCPACQKLPRGRKSPQRRGKISKAPKAVKKMA